jgi:hypothetical protein
VNAREKVRNLLSNFSPMEPPDALVDALIAAVREDDTDALVDPIIWEVCQLAESQELWADTRRDPDAYRRAVSRVLARWRAFAIGEVPPKELV